jgi:folate-binding protein YgfZ
LDFLNKFLTNQLIDRESKMPLKAGEGVYAFALNNKGRIVSDMNVIERGDHTLLETDARNVPALLAHLEKFVFSEQVEFASLVAQMHEIAVHGPTAGDILKSIDPNFAELAPLGSAMIRIAGSDITIWRDDPCGSSGYFLIVPMAAAAAVWAELETRLVRSVGWAAFNSTRIEAGRAMFGIDFDDTVLPAETGQWSRSVSLTKGCYLGQEIVARMHARGQAAKQIVGIRMAGEFLPIAGAPVYDETSNQVGIITSSTISPILSNAAIALAMVKKQFTALGTKLRIAAEGAMREGSVVELPFIKLPEKQGKQE